MMDRPELGSLLGRLLGEVLRREQQLLDPSGLRMWDYVVLAALAREQAPTQAALAATTGRDKTRLIGNLDHLEDRGLITRRPDPADRRNRIVVLTAAGRSTYERLHAAILEMEEELLGSLSADRRRALVQTLSALVGELGLD